MGYTVNIVANVELLRENFSGIAEDTREFIEAWERATGKKVRGASGRGEPTIDEGSYLIAFNGDEEGGEDYESFVLEIPDLRNTEAYEVVDIEPLYSLDEDTFYEFLYGERELQSSRIITSAFSFYTKTSRKPYDAVVKAVALSIKARLGEQSHISCDGLISEWGKALELVRKVRCWDLTDDLYRDFVSTPHGAGFFGVYQTYEDYKRHAPYVLKRLEENKKAYAEMKKKSKRLRKAVRRGFSP